MTDQDPGTPGLPTTDRDFYRQLDLRQYLSPAGQVQLEHHIQECMAELTSHYDHNFTEELGWLLDQYGNQTP
jgi:hypothetical protein